MALFIYIKSYLESYQSVYVGIPVVRAAKRTFGAQDKILK